METEARKATPVRMVRLNEVRISGYLGNDPKVGDKVANFSVAVTESWKDKTTDEWCKKTTWVQCSCFGKTKDIVAHRAFKGTPIVVFGKLSSYKPKDSDREVLTVLADRVQILTAGDAPAAAEPKPRAENPSEPGDNDRPGDPLDQIPW
jgi:single-strand DNA-binding protein